MARDDTGLCKMHFDLKFIGAHVEFLNPHLGPWFTDGTGSCTILHLIAHSQENRR